MLVLALSKARNIAWNTSCSWASIDNLISNDLIFFDMLFWGFFGHCQSSFLASSFLCSCRFFLVWVRHLVVSVQFWLWLHQPFQPPIAIAFQKNARNEMNNVSSAMIPNCFRGPPLQIQPFVLKVRSLHWHHHYHSINLRFLWLYYRIRKDFLNFASIFGIWSH